MTETLLDRAVSNFNLAKVNMRFINDDDVYINFVGYLLQQSLELCLKHILEVNSIRYPKTQSIDELLGMLPDNFNVDSTSVLMMAGTITSWESKTRYIKNFRLNLKQVELGFSVIRDFIEGTIDCMSTNPIESLKLKSKLL